MVVAGSCKYSLINHFWEDFSVQANSPLDHHGSCEVPSRRQGCLCRYFRTKPVCQMQLTSSLSPFKSPHGRCMSMWPQNLAVWLLEALETNHPHHSQLTAWEVSVASPAPHAQFAALARYPAGPATPQPVPDFGEAMHPVALGLDPNSSELWIGFVVQMNKRRVDYVDLSTVNLGTSPGLSENEPPSSQVQP